MASPHDIGERFIEAFNAHDESRIRELNADGAKFEAPGDIELEGGDAATQYAMGWTHAFPDAKLTVHNEIAAGDWVAQEFTFEGTHEDTLMSPGGEIPATHKHLRGRGVQILKIEDGAIAETRLYFDQVQVLTQLGLMPDAVAAG